MPVLVARLHQHALAVERVLEPAERHREAALVAAVAAPAGGRVGQRREVLARQVRVRGSLDRVAAALETRHRLAHRLHARARRARTPRRSTIASSPISYAIRPASVNAAGALPRRRPSPPATSRCAGRARATARSPRASARVADRVAAGQAHRAEHAVATPRRGPWPGHRCPRRRPCRAGWRSSRASRAHRSPAAAAHLRLVGTSSVRSPEGGRNRRCADDSTTAAPTIPISSAHPERCVSPSRPRSRLGRCRPSILPNTYGAASAKLRRRRTRHQRRAAEQHDRATEQEAASAPTAGCPTRAGP